MKCKIESCEGDVYAKSVCSRHYDRYRRAGDYNIEDREYGFNNKKHPLYATWQGMKARCYNKNNANYEQYGGRGISVCDRWRNSFQAFLIDMGDRPEGHTLDRVDNNGDYSPTNCRWATYSKQALNRRPKRNSGTGITGVCFNKQIGKYVVRRHNALTGKRDYLGLADTLDEAIELYETPKHKRKH